MYSQHDRRRIETLVVATCLDKLAGYGSRRAAWGADGSGRGAVGCFMLG
jgi:hypothetical protein